MKGIKLNKKIAIAISTVALSISTAFVAMALPADTKVNETYIWTSTDGKWSCTDQYQNPISGWAVRVADTSATSVAINATDSLEETNSTTTQLSTSSQKSEISQSTTRSTTSSTRAAFGNARTITKEVAIEETTSARTSSERTSTGKATETTSATTDKNTSVATTAIYYLDRNGVMKTGWVKDSGSWYYLDEITGVLATSRWVDNYYVDETGAMVKIK